jgi:arylsulfatase A-like enzyme
MAMEETPVRRAVAAAAVKCALLVLIVLACSCRTADPRPDVVVIVLDAVRADHLSAYGYGRLTTPVIDRLASDGVLYRRAISAGTWTVPGHASLLTGRLPTSHGAYRAPGEMNAATALDSSVATVAERLSAAGYDTAAFLGNHAYLDPAFGLSRGFRVYETDNLYPAATLVRRVTAWLDHEARRPAFLFLNVLDAHEPYAAPPPYDRLFPGRLDHVGDVNHEYLRTGQLPTPEILTHCVSQYDGELRYMDDQLGRLLAELQRLGRLDGALVVLTADHGELFGEHGVLGHGTLPWDPLVHVPLIVKYPHASRRGAEARPVSLVDVAPTILSVVGLPPLPDAQGAPLWERSGPVVAEELGPTGDGARAVYDDTGHVLFAQGGGESHQLALYDLGNDPDEERPLPVEGAGVRLETELTALLAGMSRAPRGPVATRNTKVQERLRALGYVQ